MECDHMLFYSPSFHIFQFFMIYYKPAQTTLTPWHGWVVIFSISSQIRHSDNASQLGVSSTAKWDTCSRVLCAADRSLHVKYEVLNNELSVLKTRRHLV